MKTIFVTSFFGLIARNILATDFLKILRSRPDLRVVILTPEIKAENYRRLFGGSNVIVEGVPLPKPFFKDRFFTVLFHHLSDTAAWRIHRLIYRKSGGNLLLAGVYWLLSKLGYSKTVRRLARWAEYRCLPKNRHRKLFEKYEPDLVFATDVFHEQDLDVMREAKSRGVKIIGMIRSWDNVTTKGLNRLIPDELVVNTEKIKEEAICYNDIAPEKIRVVGIPHYDNYIREKRSSKEELFGKLGLDPRKKTVFFAPPSDIYAEGDPIAEVVVKALGRLDAQLLLRLYLVGGVDLGDIKPVSGKLAIDEPGSGSDFQQADLTSGDAHLADLLFHSDVVVAFASTLAIDAVVFGKPVVFVGFDGTAGRSYWQSLRRFYDYDHQRSILKTGGVKLAGNTEELVGFVKDYLANPRLNEEGRRKIMEERCWKLDGKSGERLANFVLSHVG